MMDELNSDKKQCFDQINTNNIMQMSESNNTTKQTIMSNDEIFKLQKESNLEDNNNSDEKMTCYKCKKCRFKLFNTSNVVTHIKTYHEKCKDERKECSQELYVEPLSWFADKLEDLEGKINCPKCDAKLGSFNWCGSVCSCGSWVTPSFHISTSKADVCLPFK